MDNNAVKKDQEISYTIIPSTCFLGEKIDITRNEVAHAFPLKMAGPLVEFTMDSCFTNNVCRDKSLFMNVIKTIYNEIMILGVGGFSKREGTEEIKFTIKDLHKNNHNIIQDNVYIFPEAPNNLISMSQ